MVALLLLLSVMSSNTLEYFALVDFTNPRVAWHHMEPAKFVTRPRDRPPGGRSRGPVTN